MQLICSKIKKEKERISMLRPVSEIIKEAEARGAEERAQEEARKRLSKKHSIMMFCLWVGSMAFLYSSF